MKYWRVGGGIKAPVASHGVAKAQRVVVHDLDGCVLETQAEGEAEAEEEEKEEEEKKEEPP